MDEVMQALAAEFSLPDPARLTTILVRVLVAALLGAVIGWEREQKGRAAGLKTHILVSVGSALFILAPTLAGLPGGDNAVIAGTVGTTCASPCTAGFKLGGNPEVLARRAFAVIDLNSSGGWWVPRPFELGLV